MTTEHFTLQSARGNINAEFVAQVNLYFLTLSSLVVALAFLTVGCGFAAGLQAAKNRTATRQADVFLGMTSVFPNLSSF